MRLEIINIYNVLDKKETIPSFNLLFLIQNKLK